MKRPAAAVCPCGNLHARSQPASLAQCCGRYMGDFEGTPAPHARALMRSRYSAFVLGDAQYLLATWHPSTRPAEVEIDPGTKWLGLEVRDHQDTGADWAVVEFVARYRLAGRAVRLHERSRFVHDQGRWYYLDGDMI